jgi:hypothetical protein
MTAMAIFPLAAVLLFLIRAVFGAPMRDEEPRHD